MLGTFIGNYRLVTELGGGAMGDVYYAEHALMGRRAAIKIIREELSRDSAIIERFVNEARAVNAIQHPNIVQITDFGQLGALYYLVMELLEGETLEARLEREPRLNEATALHIAGQVCDALSAAHALGIVHRDLKPENIFLANTRSGRPLVKVLDFGVAKLTQINGRPEVTMPGMLLGTPHYMSPEQCRADANLDHRSDVYAMGVVLYRMLSGQLPLDSTDLLQLLYAHVHTEPQELSSIAPEVSPRTAAAVMRALSKSPDERFEDMTAFRSALLDTDPAAATLAQPVPQALPAAPAPQPVRGASPASATEASGPRPVPQPRAGATFSTTRAAALGQHAKPAPAPPATRGAPTAYPAPAPKTGLPQSPAGKAAPAPTFAGKPAQAPAAAPGKPGVAPAAARAAQPVNTRAPAASPRMATVAPAATATATVAPPTALAEDALIEPLAPTEPPVPNPEDPATSISDPEQTQRAANRLTRIVLERLHSGRLQLPTLPSTALRCIEQLRETNFSGTQLADTLARDPLLATQVIRYANNVLVGGGARVKTLEVAVGRLGAVQLRALIMELSARQLFESRNPAIRHASQLLWDHALAVGNVAQDIAKRIPGARPDMAYLAGLLHDIGKPVIAAVLLEAERQAVKTPQEWINASNWLEIVADCHREVGVAVARAWLLPDDVMTAIARSNRFTPEGRTATTNLVCFANALVKEKGVYAGPMDIEEVQSLVKQGQELYTFNDEQMNAVRATIRRKR